MAARRADDPELLATEQSPGPCRRPDRFRHPAPPALDAPSGTRRGSPGALSVGRLLARPPASPAKPALERLRLVVPDRAGRDGRAAVRGYCPRHLRPCDPHVPHRLLASRAVALSGCT